MIPKTGHRFSDKDNAPTKGGRLVIREPTIGELPELGELCLRSKAVWGYDEKFMEACCGELSFAADDLRATRIAVAECGSGLAGVVQIKATGTEADLLKLFIEPAILHNGIGIALFGWAADEARKLGATQVIIEADPGAVPFYRRMGAHHVGFAPSRSIAGRMLPKLAFDLY